MLQYRFMHWKLVSQLSIGLVIIASLGIFSEASSVKAQQVSACKDVVVIFARGSGQASSLPLGDKGAVERDALFNNLRSYLLSPQLTVDYFELNDKLPGAVHQYPAVGIDPRAGSQEFQNMIDAKVSFRLFEANGRYDESVEKGKNNLIEYFEFLRDTGELEKCSNTQYILSGYSQGAQVIGEAVRDVRMQTFLSAISFIAYFGDPKYDNGKRLIGLSSSEIPWHRGDIKPYSGGGALGARTPYAPDVLRDKVGSWCKHNDGICGGSWIDLQVHKENHGLYDEQPIKAAAAEISTVIKKKSSSSFTGPACGPAEQDFVLAIDRSSSMTRDEDFFGNHAAKKTADSIFATGCNVRVAVVGYNDPMALGPTVLHQFTDSKEDVQATIFSLYRPVTHNNQIDKLQTPVREAMIRAMELDWRPNAQKALLVTSNMVGTGGNWTAESGVDTAALLAEPLSQEVIQKSRQAGGVEVYYGRVWSDKYPSFVKGEDAYYDAFTQATGGLRLWYANTNVRSWAISNGLYDMQALLRSKPKVSVPGVRLKVGQQVTINPIDVSNGAIANSVQINGYPTTYQWYLDCQNGQQQTHSGQTITFTPTTAGTCYAAVRAYGPSWSSCNICSESTAWAKRYVAPFELEVLPADYTPPPLPGPIRNLTKQKSHSQLILQWEPPQNAAEVGEVAYVIKDDKSNVLGATKATKLQITDIPSGQEPTILIAAASENGVSDAQQSSADAVVIVAEGSDANSDETVSPSTTPSNQDDGRLLYTVSGQYSSATNQTITTQLPESGDGQVLQAATNAEAFSAPVVPRSFAAPMTTVAATNPAGPSQKIIITAVSLTALIGAGFGLKYAASRVAKK